MPNEKQQDLAQTVEAAGRYLAALSSFHRGAIPIARANEELRTRCLRRGHAPATFEPFVPDAGLPAAEQAALLRRDMLRRALFDHRERRNEWRAEAFEAARLGLLTAALRGEAVAVGALCNALGRLPITLSPPDELEVAAFDDAYDLALAVRDGGQVRVVVRAPALNIVPAALLELTPARTKLRRSKLKDSARAEIYARCLASFSLAHALRIYGVLPTVARVVVEAYSTSKEPATGRARKDVELRAVFTRAQLEPLEPAHVDALAFLATTEHECPVPKQRLGASEESERAKAVLPASDGGDWYDPDAPAEDWRDVLVPTGCLPGDRLILDNPHVSPRPWSRTAARRLVVARHAGALGTIAEAIAASNPGDIVSIEPGLYKESVEIDRPITLAALIPGTVTVAPAEGDAIRIVETPFASVRGVRLRCAEATSAALRLCGADAIVEDCDLEAPEDVVVVEPGCDLRMRGGALRGQYGVVSSGNVLLDGVLIERCFAAVRRFAGTVTLRACRVRGCDQLADPEAGAVALEQSEVERVIPEPLEAALGSAALATTVRRALAGNEDTLPNALFDGADDDRRCALARAFASAAGRTLFPTDGSWFVNPGSAAGLLTLAPPGSVLHIEAPERIAPDVVTMIADAARSKTVRITVGEGEHVTHFDLAIEIASVLLTSRDGALVPAGLRAECPLQVRLED